MLSSIYCDTVYFPQFFCFYLGFGTDRSNRVNYIEIKHASDKTCCSMIGKEEIVALNLVSKLQMQIAGFGVEPQINAFSIVPYNVLSTRILVVPSSHKFLHSRIGRMD